MRDSSTRFTVAFDNYRGAAIPARLKEYVETSSDASGFPVSLTLENPDPARYRISPGMSCTITMLSADPVPDAVSLPVSAVYAPAGGGTYVWIVGAGDRVMRREVTLGELFGRDRVVVDSGVAPGERVNIYGEVVGIVSAKYSSSSSGNAVEGLGFAIPIDDVLSMIEDIMENGQVTPRPYLGISAYYDSQPQVSGVSAGVYVESVEAGGPAEKAGLQAGDVITMIGSSIITNRDDINALSKTYKAGDTVTITYVRNGQVATTELTFGSTTEANTTSSQTTQPDTSEDGSYNPYGENGGSYSYGGDMDDFFEQYFGMTSYSDKNVA